MVVWYCYCALTGMRGYFVKALMLFFTAIAELNCFGQDNVFPYDIEKFTTIELPGMVNQISGLAFNAPDSAVFAIDDDHGDLFKIPLRQNPSIERWEFSRDHDYEDIVISNAYVYVLRSNGQIVYFPFKLPPNNVKKATVKLEGKREFESLYKDPFAERLILLCKDCNADKKSENSAFSFSLKNSEFQPGTVLTLLRNEIEKYSEQKIRRFKPSAANVNPVTKDIYILSSINKILVITDAGFRVKKVVPLNRQNFTQPEGLCFTPGGDLLISNEAADKKKANIMIFNLQ